MNNHVAFVGGDVVIYDVVIYIFRYYLDLF